MSRYSELIEKAVERLEDEKIFVSCVKELHYYNGFLVDDEVYDMDELDELFYGCSLSEFLNKLGTHFDLNDNYFQDTIYGLKSTNETPYSIYHNLYDEGQILDNLRNNYPHVDIRCIDSELADIIEELEELQGVEE